MAQIAETVKHDGDNSAFFWKHPCTVYDLIGNNKRLIFFIGAKTNLKDGGK